MKNIKFLAVAAMAALALSGCTKEINGQNDGEARLIIQLAGLQPATRAVEAAGATGQLTLVNGHIFVINAQGEVIDNAALDVAEANVTQGDGQEFPRAVPSDSKVYILGNIPSDVTVSDLTTFELIQEAESAITATANADFKKAALANSDGVAKALGTPTEVNGELTATVAVSLSPLFSRLELAQITGGGDITSFKVAGVYLDNYYPSFNLVGGGAGTIWAQGTSETFTGNIGVGNIVLTAQQIADGEVGLASAAKVVKPAGGVWAHHIGAGSVPRMIVHLKDVVYRFDTTPDGPSRTYVQRTLPQSYITVTGYDEMTGENTFERGKIYQVANLTFNVSDGSNSPNPTDVELTVSVTMLDWVVTGLTPVL